MGSRAAAAGLGEEGKETLTGKKGGEGGLQPGYPSAGDDAAAWIPTARGGLPRKMEEIRSLVFRPVGFEGQTLYSCGDVQQAIRKKGLSALQFPDYLSLLYRSLFLQERTSPLS